MTDVYLQMLRQGAQAAYFEQFLGRVKYSVEIPRKIYREEVVAFCRAFIAGKPDADLVSAATAIAKGEGKLRTLVDDMAKARNSARTKNEKLEARHLALARTWRERGGVFEDLTPA
jgi:hypothetical protein